MKQRCRGQKDGACGGQSDEVGVHAVVNDAVVVVVPSRFKLVGGAESLANLYCRVTSELPC